MVGNKGRTGTVLQPAGNVHRMRRGGLQRLQAESGRTTAAWTTMNHWISDMTDNRFAQPNPDVPGGFTLSPAGVVALAASAIHDDDAGAQGKVRAASLIRELLDAARANGYTRGQIAETVLLDYGQPLDRKKAVALELASSVGRDEFVAALRRAGFNVT